MTARTVTAIALLSVTLTSCAPQPAPAADPIACEVPVPDPPGFAHRATFEDASGGHIAVRRGLADPRGAELHLFAGVAGDFGEGLDPSGTVPLADGGLARLVGRARTWVVVWDVTGPCTPHAVLGTGIGRRRFLDVLCEVGLLARAGGRC